MGKKKQEEEAAPEQEPQNEEIGENPDSQEESSTDTPIIDAMIAENPGVSEFPVLASGDATIKDLSIKADGNILKVAIGTEMATHLAENKGLWASVELSIRSNQSCLPMAEIEEEETEGMFDDPEPVADPDGEPLEPSEEELSGDPKDGEVLEPEPQE